MLAKSELLAHLSSAGLEARSIVQWTNHRELGEWLNITNAPERAGPLRVVMMALAKAGVRAGIALRLDGDKLRFEHHPHLIVARKK